MSVLDAALAHAEGNGEYSGSAILAKELPPSNFYRPDQQNGNLGPAAELEESAAEPVEKRQKRSRSESDFSATEEEDVGSDFDAAGNSDSDDSFSRYSLCAARSFCRPLRVHILRLCGQAGGAAIQARD